jgi:CofD-related protein of GAK system
MSCQKRKDNAMHTIHVTRAVVVPDLLRLERYKKNPELGPTLLFFSGGSALTRLSSRLKEYSHNTIHMVTPFDSGGSSAVLRKAFDMPSIGDLRSRMMALADMSITGHPNIYRLFTYRFSREEENGALLERLRRICSGKERLIRAVPNPMRRLIRIQLGYFLERMPSSFDLRGASIGNLILAGGYLNNHKHLDPIIFLFSKLVNVHGTVRAIVNDDLHLGVTLEDGSQILGQHRMTGKECPPLASPVKQLFLSADLDQREPAEATLRKKNGKLIRRAELICYPPGSFYSSLIANLLPNGVSRAIATNHCPKVYVPNLGHDPEQIGMTMDDAIRTLLHYLQQGSGPQYDRGDFINFVLIDSNPDTYPDRVSALLLDELGIQLIETKLVRKRNAEQYDPALLASALLSLT